MAGYIGGNLTDIATASSGMTDASAAATDASVKASQTATTLTQEIDAIGTTLTQHFTEMGQTLTSSITTAKQKLGVAEWQGNARTTADTAETNLNTHVQQTINASNEAVTQLKTALAKMVNDFKADVDGKFKNVLTEINTSYADLANAMKVYSQNLAEVDQNSIKIG